MSVVTNCCISGAKNGGTRHKTNKNLLVDLGSLVHKISDVSFEVTKVFNDPLKDTFKALCRVLKGKHSFEVERTLEFEAGRHFAVFY